MNDTTPTEEKILFKSFKGLLTKFTPKEQMEISLVSLVGMILMLIITTIYLVFFQDITLTFKILIAINAVFGVGFLFSLLATTYQQYLTIVTVGNVQEMAQGIKALGDLIT